MLNDKRMLTAWLPLDEIALDGGGGIPLTDDKPAPEGFVKDFITNQVLKIVKAKFDDIKKAFLSGDTTAIKEVVAWLIVKLKEQTGIVVTDANVMAVVEFAIALIGAASDLPKAIKEGGELLIATAGLSFLAAKPLYATIVRQVGELLVAVAAELGKKPLLVGDATPDDRFGAAIEDFEAMYLTAAGVPPGGGSDAEFGIIEIITIGRLLFEAVQWIRRRRQEKREASTSAVYLTGEALRTDDEVLFIGTSQSLADDRRDAIEKRIEAKTGYKVIVLDGGMAFQTVV